MNNAANKSTPAAKWREDGKEDPHSKMYDSQRSNLCMGNLTDDELANAVFLHGDVKLSPQELINGDIPGFAYLTAAKERIRWLSRSNERLTKLIEMCDKDMYSASGKISKKTAIQIMKHAGRFK